MSKESENEYEAVQLQYKIIILGDGAVGKTSIALRQTEDVFSNTYKQTIGLDFFLRRLTLSENTPVTLQIWDIGGQSIGGKMLRNYINGAQNSEDWYQLVWRTFGQDSLPYIALVGNKSDLNHIRAVEDEKHKQFVAESHLHSFQVSAKTGDRVDSMFRQIAADLAGIKLSKAELEDQTPILRAQIINHAQHDPDVKDPDIRAKDRGCLLQ
uniref:Ras family GTPase putative n=1 Tax=Albugo laibachii Nc14 TaxID=890382 RepID=F0W8Q8_9STRA|nr:ras family GTPase putative [Albugo laibachii Nc14]|eukprot:CCA17515.1 ras family GTPase putative [Albugo laibachii Nc14]